MSTKTKPHKTKKSKSKKSKSKKGLGATKMDAVKGMGAKVAKPVGAILGLVGASVIGWGLDKIPFLAPDPTTGERSLVAKVVKPLVLVGAGGAAVVLTHKKSGAGADLANGLGWGLVGGGVFAGVKAFTGTDVFTGLGQDPSAAKANLQVQYFKDKADDMAKILEKSRYEVEVPEYSSDDSSAINGGEGVKSEMNLLSMDTLV
ncbi:MAG TPA: hypothetical protein VGC65_00210 [Bacteroidia bacterium]|jgi:hypothetical protein